MRTALAMGADRGILMQTDAVLEPLAVAKLLKAVVERESPELVILGKQADRRRQQPDRSDAVGPAGLVAGYLRLEARDRPTASSR